jgi:uncharacterized iron-regulated protein
MIRSRILATLLACSLPAFAQQRASVTWLPAETNGLDRIVEALISTFDHADVLGLTEAHWDKHDSDLRIALVRHPGFPKKVRFIVVECASTADQMILDQYVRGEDVPRAALQRVWTNTTQRSNVWQSPVYENFLTALREVNAGLPPTGRIRVLAGDPPPGSRIDRDGSAVSVIEKNVLHRNAKALVVYGSEHLRWTEPEGLTSRLEQRHRGLRIVVVYTTGGPRPYFSENFEPALTSRMRPVLVPLGRTSIGNFSYGRFTYSQLFDACVYWVPVPT